MNEVFALIDCNNFFASCERSFDPKLIGRPVVILSNNDGCVIARSEEAKKLGIPMGVAAHKYKDVFKYNNVAVLSSNFSLYGDMSNRVMKILNEFSPQQEIYSIDESFLRLSKIHINDYALYGKEIVKKVQTSLGLPISVGIAKSKTLAKAANKLAKKNYAYTHGAMDLMEENTINYHLKTMPVIDIWGIGYRTTKYLNSQGIYTALDFKQASPEWVRDNLGVNGTRTQLELYGTSCLEIDDIPNPKKGILSSRSFRNDVTKKEDLEEAVSTYIARAAEKLREQNSLASIVTIYIVTNFHRVEMPQYRNSYSIALPYPSNYNPDLIKAGLKALNIIYKPGYYFKKAYVYLSSITPQASHQYNLFEKDTEKKHRFMNAVDEINNKMGDDSVFYASQGILQPWRAKQENTSPAYTRRWDELPVAN